METRYKETVVIWGRTADPEFEYPKSRAYLQKR